MAPYGLGAPTPRVSRKASWLWHHARGRRAPGPPPAAPGLLQVRPWPLGPRRGRSSPPRGDAHHLGRLRPRVRCPSRGELKSPSRVGRTAGRPPRGFSTCRPSQEPTSRVTAPQKWLALCGGVVVSPLPQHPDQRHPPSPASRFPRPVCAARSQAMGSAAGPGQATGR